MFELYFDDGIKCLCSQVHLRDNSRRKDVRDFDHNYPLEKNLKDEQNPIQKPDLSCSLEDPEETNQEENLELDEEQKLMQKMGLPTSFGQKENTYSQINFELAEEERLMQEMGLPTSFGPKEKMQKHKLKKEQTIVEFDETIEVPFIDYWQMYWKEILLNTWNAHYVTYERYDYPMMSPKILENDIVENSQTSEEENLLITSGNQFISNKSSHLFNTENQSDLCSSDCFNLKTQNGEISELYDEIKNKNESHDDTYKTNIFVEQNLDSQINSSPLSESNELSKINNISDSNEIIKGNQISNLEATSEHFDENELVWEETWKTHVEWQMNYVYKFFKQQLTNGKRLDIFVDEYSDKKLEELHEHQLVIHDPPPFRIKRFTIGVSGFKKWWKKSLKSGYLLWKTYFNSSVHLEDEFYESDNIDCCDNSATDTKLKLETDYILHENNEMNVDILKYMSQRHQLFSLYDEGIILDEESWYSVTPEKIAEHIAKRCRCDIIVDAFCGAGGNTIQFALTCHHVIGIDIDPKKIELAENNAKVYDLGENIDFICGNFFHVASNLKADIVFLSPPWGGPDYEKEHGYSISSIQPDIYSLLKISRFIAPCIALYVPKTTIINEIISLSEPDEYIEIEQNFLNNKLKAMTVYFMSDKTDVTSEET